MEFIKDIRKTDFGNQYLALDLSLVSKVVNSVVDVNKKSADWIVKTILEKLSDRKS